MHAVRQDQLITTTRHEQTRSAPPAGEPLNPLGSISRHAAGARRIHGRWHFNAVAGFRRCGRRRAVARCPQPWNLLACAAGIQLRLLCNLLDGMVAVEGGRKSKVGVLYNEVPDRVADSLFLVALGYAIAIPWLGWLGALAAAVTAYIRVLGGTFGLAQDFRGPLAKQHRMAVMTRVACSASVSIYWTRRPDAAVVAAAWIIAPGVLRIVTCGTRIRAIARQLKAR